MFNLTVYRAELGCKGLKQRTAARQKLALSDRQAKLERIFMKLPDTPILAVGYYADASQTAPTYDPGLLVDCPFCSQPLDYPKTPIKTISLMRADRIDRADGRSYFYRAHKSCYESSDLDLIGSIEATILNFDEGELSA